jgi:fructuronate reductase
MTRRVRIAHLGLGAFARSHQAWYTQEASEDWGIAAFPTRSHTVVDALAAQGFRYGLVVREASGDRATVIESVIATGEPQVFESPELAVVTMTVSEAGYLPGAAPLKQLAALLRVRRDSGAGALAIVPCDNLPSNGAVLRDGLRAIAPDLVPWLADNVSFVSTMVDRITPATTPADVAIATALLGWNDAVPVVTEPFTEWVLQGEFPGGRPDWQNAGAQFVDDVEPYEQRKLWMLNAAHSLLAYRGLELGLSTVYEAWHALGAEAEQLWSEAREVLPLDAGEVDEWLTALRARWENPRIEHRLEQIAEGGEQKIPARILAVMDKRTEAGLPVGVAEQETVAAWERYRKAHS